MVLLQLMTVQASFSMPSSSMIDAASIPLRQRGQDGGCGRVDGANVFLAAADQGVSGPTEAPTRPTRCGIGFCAAAVL
jgi:hypothetical protein